MIFYFSGTGNSQAVAQVIATRQQEELVPMIQVDLTVPYLIKENENIVFVFPIYAWRPPQQVIDFIKQIEFKNYYNHPITMIATCGENIGETLAVFKKMIHQRKWTLSNAYSLVMPNNDLRYGNIDARDEVQRKLKKVELELEKINQNLTRRATGIYQVEKGPFSYITTYVVGNLFNRFARSTHRFFATDDCISCKICEKVCPIRCITVSKKPIWKNSECTQCLACVNYCPKSAIQYGKRMSRKARYTHPLVAWHQLNQNRKPKD